MTKSILFITLALFLSGCVREEMTPFEVTNLRECASLRLKIIEAMQNKDSVGTYLAEEAYRDHGWCKPR